MPHNVDILHGKDHRYIGLMEKDCLWDYNNLSILNSTMDLQILKHLHDLINSGFSRKTGSKASVGNIRLNLHFYISTTGYLSHQTPDISMIKRYSSILPCNSTFYIGLFIDINAALF